MPNIWEKTRAEKERSGLVDDLFKSVGVGQSDGPWVVEYTNRATGKKIVGRGKTLEEAERKALAQIG